MNRSSDNGRERPESVTYTLTDEARCPHCGGWPKFSESVAGERYVCSECGATYDHAGRDTCFDCGKPLGSSGLRCYSCESGGGE